MLFWIAVYIKFFLMLGRTTQHSSQIQNYIYTYIHIFIYILYYIILYYILYYIILYCIMYYIILYDSVKDTWNFKLWKSSFIFFHYNNIYIYIYIYISILLRYQIFFTRETIKIRALNRKTNSLVLGWEQFIIPRNWKNFMKLKTESHAIKTYG